MTSYVQTWDHRLVPADEQPRTGLVVTAELAEDIEVRHLQSQAVTVTVRANGGKVTQAVDLGVAEVGEKPRLLPAYVIDGDTCFLTASLPRGRYVMYAGHAGQVVRAMPGILRVR